MPPAYRPSNYRPLPIPSTLTGPPAGIFDTQAIDFSDAEKQQAALRAQELNNQAQELNLENSQMRADEQRRQLEQEKRVRDALTAQYGGGLGVNEFDPEEGLNTVQRIALESGDIDTALKVEKAKQDKRDQFQTLSGADREFLGGLGLNVPEGVSSKTFGSVGNLINSGTLMIPRANNSPELPGPGTTGSDDPTNFDISRIPKPRQKDAIKEIGVLSNLNKSKKILDDVYETIGNLDFIQENTPFSATSAQSDAARSSIMSTLVASWKGPMSDSDERKIKGLIPSSRDTKEQVQEKKKQLLLLLENNAAATPTLDYYNPGIRKRQLFQDLPEATSATEQQKNTTQSMGDYSPEESAYLNARKEEIKARLRAQRGQQ